MFLISLFAKRPRNTSSKRQCKSPYPPAEVCYKSDKAHAFAKRFETLALKFMARRLKSRYRNASNKRPGAYLMFKAPRWALIRGRRLIEGALIQEVGLGANCVVH